MMSRAIISLTVPPVTYGFECHIEATAEAAKARKPMNSRPVLPDGSVLHLRVWEVPKPVPPSAYRFKYSLSMAVLASAWFSTATSEARETTGAIVRFYPLDRRIRLHPAEFSHDPHGMREGETAALAF